MMNSNIRSPCPYLYINLPHILCLSLCEGYPYTSLKSSKKKIYISEVRLLHKKGSLSQRGNSNLFYFIFLRLIKFPKSEKEILKHGGRDSIVQNRL